MVTGVLEGGPLDGRRVDADVAEDRPVAPYCDIDVNVL
jgi:hypothetical protein